MLIRILEFETWKSRLEENTNTQYTKSSGVKIVSGEKQEYYYCNRSGYFKTHSKGLRAIKSQGTSKMDSYCTAKICLQRLKNGEVQAHITKTHYGHKISLGHLRLSKQDKLSVAGQLLQGVNFDSLLDKVRDNVGTKLQRIHLIVKKDLYNIERAFSIRGCQRHSSDYISVALWVKEMVGKEEESPVLFYKQQGQTKAEVGTNIGLSENDFALVIQTPLQAEMLKKCGSNKVICVDATHGTTAYDFLLISLIVVDEFGEGFPAGWCFSNREDKTVLVNFFTHLKNRCGKINPQWFMSDDFFHYVIIMGKDRYNQLWR